MSYLYRLKRDSEGMSGVVNQLNWRNDTRFVQLSGILPVESAVPLRDRVINFSAAAGASDKVCRDAITQRGFELTGCRISCIHGGM